MQEWLFPMGVVLLGYCVLGITGFGSALVVVPLLTWIWPLPEVVALILCMDMLASALHSGLNWRQVQWKELLRLLPGMVLGTLAGLWLAGQVSSRWPLFVLGLYVAGVGLRALRPSTRQSPLGAVWGHLYGTLLGLIEVMFGTAGPVAVAWLTRRLEDPRQIRASVPMIMTVAATTVLAGFAFDGRLTSPLLWQRLGVLMVVSLAGVVLGHRVSHHLPVERLRQLICALLVLSGAVLTTRALL
jgi:uncharacterized membrane protein YfcA